MCASKFQFDHFSTEISKLDNEFVPTHQFLLQVYLKAKVNKTLCILIKLSHSWLTGKLQIRHFWLESFYYCLYDHIFHTIIKITGWLFGSVKFVFSKVFNWKGELKPIQSRVWVQQWQYLNFYLRWFEAGLKKSNKNQHYVQVDLHF